MNSTDIITESPTVETTSTSTSVPATSPSDDSAFCKTSEWYIILGFSAGSYVFCLLVFFIAHLIRKRRRSKSKEREEQGDDYTALSKNEELHTLFAKLQFQLQAILNGTNIFGKLAIGFNAVCVIISFSIYVNMTYVFMMHVPKGTGYLYTGKDGLRGCVSKHDIHTVYVDFFCNVYFAFFYCVRFIGCENHQSFWLSFETVSDHLTIIPTIIMFVLDRYMITFQFLRLTGLKYFLNILIYCHIIKGRKIIRLIALLIQIATVWAISAGIFQLIESIGNFWLALPTTIQYEYFSCIYFLLITMSTVGYGDISPESTLGRVFIILFIILALGMFTSIIPEISAILTEDKRYKRAQYHAMKGKQHVIVCGYLTLNSMKSFINDFFHDDRDERPYRVAFLGDSEPDITMEALIKTRELYVSYYQGDLMSTKDLDRVCVKEASAVIVLANLQSSDPDMEDLNNIMRVIAIKDYCPTASVLVVLSKYRSKTYLMNIPDWQPQEYGDSALCINEIKMGLLSQSCNAPGMSTLLCNLLMPRAPVTSSLAPGSWENEYHEGTKFGFYRLSFSPYFEGKTFAEAASICLEHLDICLLAVETHESPLGKPQSISVSLNPGQTLVINTSNMKAFVIAKNKTDAKKVSRCDKSFIKSKQKALLKNNLSHLSLNEHEHIELPTNNCDTGKNNVSLPAHSVSQRKPTHQRKLDSTGFFYWVHKQTFQSRLLRTYEKYEFRNHIIVCILDKDRSRGTIGLCNFIMPLRAGVVREDKLKDILIVGDAELIQSEWYTLENFPKIYVMDTSPMNRAHLKAANISQCSACVILAPSISQIAPGHRCALLLDKETVLCTLNIKTMVNEENGRLLGDSIHILTELNSEEAIAYLDQDDDPVVDDTYMSQAFATGRTFFQGLLDNLICTAFFNRAAIDFLRTIVTTVNTEEFEVELNEQGFQLQACRNTEKTQRTHLRSQIELISVRHEPVNSVFVRVSQRWKIFSLEMLKSYQTVCLGISRLQSEKKDHRYVITFPPVNTLIQPDDMIFCLTPPL